MDGVEIIVKWSGEEYKISGLSDAQCVKDLKLEIQKQTCVRPERQKLLGLKYKGANFKLKVEKTRSIILRPLALSPLNHSGYVLLEPNEVTRTSIRSPILTV